MRVEPRVAVRGARRHVAPTAAAVLAAGMIVWSGTVQAQGGASPTDASQSYLSQNGSDPATTRGASRLLHYLPEDLPIRLYVPAAPVAGGEALRRRVVDAFLAWQQAAPEIVSIEVLTTPDEGALMVRWQPFDDGRVGSYSYSYGVLPDGRYRFRTSEVMLDPRYDGDTTYRYALLQAGHALGLLGRSPFAGDAMSGSPSGEITGRDVATLRALYAVPSGTEVTP